MLRICLTMFIASLFGLNVSAQSPVQKQINFRHLTAQDGLSSEKIRCLLQDQKGFIWVGTNDGLNRYDGTEVKIFQRIYGDTTSLSHNSISALYQDDSGLIWIGTNGGGLNCYDPVQDKFISYQTNPANTSGINSNRVMSIWEDEENNLWLGTGRGGLNRWNRKDSTFNYWLPVPYENNTPSEQLNNSIRAIASDAKNPDRLWLGSFNGLYSFDRVTYQFKYHHPQPNTEDPKDLEITSIFSEQSGKIWMSAKNGEVRSFNPVSNSWKTFRYLSQLEDRGRNSPTLIRQLVAKSNSEIWVCTYDKGLGVFNTNNGTFDFVVNDPYNPSSILPGAVHCLIKGDDNTTWVGTYRGLSRIDPQAQLFNHIDLDSKLAPDPRNFNIEGIVDPGDGRIYAGTPDADGLYVVNKSDHQVTTYPYHQSHGVSHRLLIRDLYFDTGSDQLWILDHKKLLQFDRIKNEVLAPENDLLKSIDLEPYDPIEIFKDSQGSFWIGTSNSGVLKIEVASQNFIHYKHDPKDDNSLLDDIDIHHIIEDNQGDIWITSNQGVSKLTPDRNQFLHFRKDLSDPNSLSFHTSYALVEDDDRNIWLGTLGGLNKISPDHDNGNKVTVYTRADGLPNDRIFRMVKDRNGFIWLATEHGLSRLDTKTMTFRNFNDSDGLKSILMNHPMELSPKGEILLAYPSGISYFHPDRLKEADSQPTVVMTSLKVFGRDIQLEKNVDYLSGLNLSYDQNSFSFTFSGLNYHNPESNRYAYQLEGFDSDWIFSEKRNFVSYTNVEPGDYTFKVKVSSSDNFSDQMGKNISISIAYPWWQRWWAYTIYILATVGLVYTAYSFQRKRWELRNQLHNEHREAERLKELDEFKSRLYTNITHEFRTPLTVIQGMADQIPELIQMEDRPKYLEAVDLIKRNGGNLLQLINQMLDLAKLESNNFPLSMVQSEVVGFLKYLVSSFQSFAPLQNIALQFEANPKTIVMDYDPTQLQKIVSNLLSNAIKFTPAGGEIRCKASQADLNGQSWLKLEVGDTGKGIATEDLPRIFDRFYQVADSGIVGSGIGLALTKELTKLMGGDIQVSSEKGKGTIFTVSLPITNQAPNKEVESPKIIEAQEQPREIEPDAIVNDNELPLLLIIEDNRDVTTYLTAILDKEYLVHCASDGQEGIEKALSIVPDLVVSDVMMPHKDGFEVCLFLKNDPRTSHIPVILLTAKAEVEDRIVGLKRGADAYIAKPFNKEELLANLSNLLTLREKLQAVYSGENKPTNLEVQANPVEDAFIKQMHEAVEANLSDGDFGVHDLCRIIGMSRTQIHRKLKALTNYSTTHFIRSIRLRKAKILLETSTLNVSEVAYEVGFNNPSYFHRTFVQEYGIKPSEVRG